MQRSLRRAATLATGIDPWLMLAFLGLMCIGILMVYSSSIGNAYTYYGSQYFYLERELVWVGVGFGALMITMRMSYRKWEKLALPMFVVAVVLLAVVMVPHLGHSSHGARRWISLTSFFSLEPSELIKLALVVYLAAWLTSKGDKVRDFKECLVPFGLIVGMIALFIVKQPDLGTTIVVGAISVAILFVAGANLSHVMAIGSVAVGFGWLLTRGQTYQSGRITAFLNPWQDPAGTGYHTIQALVALRNGGVLGRGLGNSSQKYLLPAPHTDSILAVIGEELGLIGTLTVLALFLLIAYRGLRISAGAPDGFSRLLAAGITAWITLQALMNFAVITSSVPFTGVPLPFVSYGGTSLVITMAAMGILLNISRHVSREGIAFQNPDNGRRNGRPRVPRVVYHPAPSPLSDSSSGHRIAPRRAPNARLPVNRTALR